MEFIPKQNQLTNIFRKGNVQYFISFCISLFNADMFSYRYHEQLFVLFLTLHLQYFISFLSFLIDETAHVQDLMNLFQIKTNKFWCLPTYPLRARWHIRLKPDPSIYFCPPLSFLLFSRFFLFSLDLSLLSFSMSVEVFLSFFILLLVSMCCFCDGVVSFSNNMTQPSKLSLFYNCAFLSCSYIWVFICYFPGPVDFTYFP